MMKRQVLPREQVRKALEGFATVELNVSRHADVADRYGVIGSPTFVILDAAGKALDTRSGYIPADEFIRFLQRASGSGTPESR